VSTETITRKELAPGRAVLTGGLIMKKKVTHEVTSHTNDIEPVVYVFARAASVPWCLHERQLRYDALGGAVTTSSVTNFELLVDALRMRAPTAVFDTRLVNRRVDVETLDLLVHLVARGMPGGDAPFR
jgi:hypothetical protein